MTLLKLSRLSLCAFAIAAALLTSAGRADLVASTFGPGDSYGPGAFGVQSTQSVAQMFTYTGGLNFQLTQIRLALWADVSPYSIQFWHGSNLNSASLLESWTLTASTEDIYTLLSAATPLLTTGDDYWISAENSGDTGAWSKNNQGIMGTGGRFPLSSSIWVIFPNPELIEFFPPLESAAYDVTVQKTEYPSVPDGANTLGLLALSLTGLALLRRRFGK